MMNNKINGESRKERCLYQLEQWVNGNPIHNDIDDECCPDFSCCNPKFLQPKKVREVFAEVCKKADVEDLESNNHPHYDTKMGMLMGFLGNAIAKYIPDKKVYISDGNISIKKDNN